jgi:hypothetical protein
MCHFPQSSCSPIVFLFTLFFFPLATYSSFLISSSFSIFLRQLFHIQSSHLFLIFSYFLTS